MISQSNFWKIATNNDNFKTCLKSCQRSHWFCPKIYYDAATGNLSTHPGGYKGPHKG